MTNSLPSCYDYLVSKGFRFKRSGGKDFTNSPFNSNDRTPSFVIFPDGRWKCFSTGKAGNITTLMRFFGDSKDSLSSVKAIWVPPQPREIKPWKGIPAKFLDVTPEERQAVEEYAKSRCITHHYHPGVTYYQQNGKFIKTPPAIMLPHQDINGNICGAKFRFIEAIAGQRFTSRGKLGFFVLEHLVESYETPEIWLIEGELNAISLYDYFVTINKPAIIMSAGGVGVVPSQLPTKYSQLKGNVLIDFDGSEEKYQERLELYKHLNLLPVKLILPKGEDINSLTVKGQINLIENCI